MNQPKAGSTPAAGSSAKETPSAHPSIWSRLVDDLHARPGRYINGVLIAAVPILILVIGVRVWRDYRDTGEGGIASRWREATLPLKPAKERVPALELLRGEVQGDPQAAALLFDLATGYHQLAEEATTQDEKISYYEKMKAACEELKAKHPKHLYATMPLRPPESAGGATTTPVDQLLQTATKELEWFRAHPYAAPIAPDPDLKVTFELADGRKFVVGKLFSKAAPYHVQNFVELARRGYFDDTGFPKIQQGFSRNVDRQNPKQTPMFVELGHPMTKVTPDDRSDDEGPQEIGYSIRDEQNPLPVVRGSLAAVADPSSGGSSPSRIKIFGDEPFSSTDVVFGEITEGLDVIDSILAAPTETDKATSPVTLIRIKKATVEGTVQNPPERPFPPQIRMPEAPKKPEPESQPVETRPSDDGAAETQPR